MKLPVSWLKKYLEVRLSPEKLAEKLTLSGSKVESVKSVLDDAVVDVEVTSNRPDCLSILGLAREVSAFTGAKVRIPEAYLAKEKKPAGKDSNLVQVTVETKKECPVYSGRVIQGVRVSASSQEVQDLLAKAGTRAISNVVDITNYVLFECGQPMHAFDLDKIRGNKITVRFSRQNEKFLGIDGIEYTLDGKTLVIADEQGVVAIAGVIGGKNTEVTDQTKNIFLESACFDPALVRQASKKYKIFTESSYRFERGVNPELTAKASLRAFELISASAGGFDVNGLILKNFIASRKEKPISLSMQKMEKVVGLKVSVTRASKILQNLSFSVTKSGKDRLLVLPSPGRRDVSKEIDLMEEVLRIEGFDKVRPRLPVSRYTFDDMRDKKAMGLFKLKKFLSAMGLEEIMTYSLLSEKKILDAGIALSDCHKVVNTTSAEQGYFRPTLACGMLDAIMFNVYRKASSLKFFEIGNRYRNGREETVLGVAFYGAFEENWSRKTQSGFFDLKGAFENILDYLGARACDFLPAQPGSLWAFGSDVFMRDIKIATLGRISLDVARRWDIPHETFYAEMVLDELFQAKNEVVKVKAISKFPWVKRDIAFVASQSVSIKQLQDCMREAAKPHLHQVVLFDQFLGKNIPSGKRSVAFSLWYQKDDGTFTDEEVQNLQSRVGDSLKKMYQVEFR